MTPDPNSSTYAGQRDGYEVFWSPDRWPHIDTNVGWYWWPCQPGCIPTGAELEQVRGPFATSLDAVIDHDDDRFQEYTESCVGTEATTDPADTRPHSLSCGCVSDGSVRCDQHGREGA